MFCDFLYRFYVTNCCSESWRNCLLHSLLSSLASSHQGRRTEWIMREETAHKLYNDMHWRLILGAESQFPKLWTLSCFLVLPLNNLIPAEFLCNLWLVWFLTFSACLWWLLIKPKLLRSCSFFMSICLYFLSPSPRLGTSDKCRNML